MSNPSPTKNNGASNVPPQPRPIRFVSSDGQPQTKRRRVTAACRTCRKRKIRCSGEQPVCKTCTDYGHTCLGYNEPDKPQSQLSTSSQASRRHGPTVHFEDDDEPLSPARSPVVPRPPGPLSIANHKSPKANKSSGAPLPLTKDTLSKATRDQEKALPVESPESSRTSLSSSNRTHVPYFRYFGPTAIVPGFKQMVVRVRDGKKNNLSQSSGSLPSLRSPQLTTGAAGSFAATLGDLGDSNTITFYDQDDNLPTSNLVTHLCDLFFVHLGCSFPFLQRDRFLKDLKDKKVDTILVDAVCALAARFSPHPLLSPPQARPIVGPDSQPDVKTSDRGQPFAHRAMTAVVDTLSCPTLSVVQACLLLAYEEFGSNHDSGLWMYLGISIRMAQDLGMQKLQGLKHIYGRIGLTPKAIISGQAGKLSAEQYESAEASKGSEEPAEDTSAEERAMERERVDTFWSIFFLDRVISSGTGRPVTLRDEDIELHFPLQSETQLPNNWTAPFPPLIRIIHLYGRVTDLINAIQEDNHIDADTLKRLAGMESDLTGIYQRLSPKLHFNAVNFQTYVKAEEGTNFILLHFWFHTLIVLLHQPTLLHSFGGRIQQLYPNSRELSMSSAKTIADILSFSELIDAKSFIGNPFTSQPMYIAACAFLMESAYYSSPSSRSGSPPILVTNQSSAFTIPHMEPTNGSERKSNAKHILLASAAKDNYQRCYKALKTLETYWEGARYILTVLDQKAKGIGDPLLYTAEEMESTTGLPAAPSLTTPLWSKPPTRPNSVDPSRRRLDDAANMPTGGLLESGLSPRIDPSQAIGWALTGAINSSQPNLSLLYQLPASQAEGSTQVDASAPYSQSYSAAPPHANVQRSGLYPQPLSAYSSGTVAQLSAISTGVPKYPSVTRASAGASPHNIVLTNPYGNPGTTTSTGAHNLYGQNLAPSPMSGSAPYGYDSAGPSHSMPNQIQQASQILPQNVDSPMGDMMIESHEIDINTLHNQDTLPFSFSHDFVPWLEYLPQDVLSYFGDQQHQAYGTQLMSPQQGNNNHHPHHHPQQ